MLIRDIFSVSTRSFRNNRLRTFLTILGISIGIGAIFFLVSLGYGFQKLILERIATSDSLLSLDVTQENEAIKINQESISEISQIENVSAVSPVITQETQISSDDFITDAKISIVGPEFFSLEAINTKKGNFFNQEDVDKMVITSAALNLLNLTDDNYSTKEVTVNIQEERGDGEIKNYEKKFLIKGIIDDEYEVKAYISNSSVADINFFNYSKLKVKVSSDDYIESVREAIIGKGYYVSAISDLVEQANQIFRIAQATLSLFGIVALVVSAIGMFNTMTIALLERTQEIGIMKTLGASSFDIWKMFLSESILISFSGGALGVIIGYLGGMAVNIGINILARSFGGMQVELFYTPIWFVLFIITFSIFIGLVTGFYPAKRAAKLNPLDALRYK